MSICNNIIEGAEHMVHQQEAGVAWEFLCHFARAADGSIQELDES